MECSECRIITVGTAAVVIGAWDIANSSIIANDCQLGRLQLVIARKKRADNRKRLRKNSECHSLLAIRTLMFIYSEWSIQALFQLFLLPINETVGSGRRQWHTFSDIYNTRTHTHINDWYIRICLLKSIIIYTAGHDIIRSDTSIL